MSAIYFYSRGFLIATGIARGVSTIEPCVRAKLRAVSILRRRTRRGRRRRIVIHSASRPTILGLVNARSLSNKSELIVSHILDYHIDLLAVTESWLSPDNSGVVINSVCPDVYAAVHLPGPNRRVGGLALIHNTSIEVKCLPLTQPTSFELFDHNVLDYCWSTDHPHRRQLAF